MARNLEKGKRYYELRLQGLTNQQIAQRYGDLPYSVGARVSEYRKANNLPKISRAGKKASKTREKKQRELNVEKLIGVAADIRAKMDEQVYRRDDGILQCPPGYAEEFPINRRLPL